MVRFNKVQLKKGIKIEMEHTSNKFIAERIAKEHLKENANYYKGASVSAPNKLVKANMINRRKRKKQSKGLPKYLNF